MPLDERATPDDIEQARRWAEQIPDGSLIVSLYGLDGVREHWVPGNRRRGTPAKEKRGFVTEDDVLAFIAARPHLGRGRGVNAYRCGVCGLFHIGRKPRHGDPRRR